MYVCTGLRFDKKDDITLDAFIQQRSSLLILDGPGYGPRKTAQRPEIPTPFHDPGRLGPWLRENQVVAVAGSGHSAEPAHGVVTATGSMARFGATRVRLGEINGLAVSQNAGRSREGGAHATRFQHQEAQEGSRTNRHGAASSGRR